MARAAERQAEHGFAGWSRLLLVDLAEAALEANDPSQAERARALTAADPATGDAPSIAALNHMAEGCARLAAGNGAAAAALFEDAVTEFGGSGWKLYEARSRALLGVALATADRPRAVACVTEAAEQFAACGATVRQERALRTLDGMGKGGRRAKTAVTGPRALTKREREVARLAAEGWSGREIAQRLFIGERTVETHLANAYAKLGVSSKMELVRLAPELDL